MILGLESSVVPERRSRSNRTRVASALASTILLPPFVASCTTSPVVTTESCGIHEGVYAHVPGSDNDQGELFNDLVCSIDDALPGSSIEISTYKIHDPVIAESLIRAQERDVDVRIVMDEAMSNDPVVHILQQRLGNDISNKSYIHMCQGSCAHPGEGIHHAKSFKVTDKRGEVLIVGTDNLDDENLIDASGINLATRDPSIIDSVNTFFKSMTNPLLRNSISQPSNEQTSISFSPYEDPHEEPIEKLLGQVECTPIDDMEEPSKIDIAMYDITMGRKDVIRRIATLASEGCGVRTIINGKSDHLISERADIVSFLRGSGVSVVYMREKPQADRILVHDKTINVDGNVDGARQRISIFGSQNLTGNALKHNDELTVHTSDPEIITAASDHFEELVSATQ